jgi:hypothetical protein
MAWLRGTAAIFTSTRSVLLGREAMPINMRGPENDRLPRELATLPDRTVAAASHGTSSQRLERERVRRIDGVARLLAIGERCAKRVERDASALDHGELLYDETGLPR